MTPEEEAREMAITDYQKTILDKSAKEVAAIAKESILRLGFYSRPMEDGLDRVRLTAAIRQMRVNYQCDFPFRVEEVDGRAPTEQIREWANAARAWVSEKGFPGTVTTKFMEWLAVALEAELNRRVLLGDRR